MGYFIVPSPPRNPNSSQMAPPASVRRALGDVQTNAKTATVLRIRCDKLYARPVSRSLVGIYLTNLPTNRHPCVSCRLNPPTTTCALVPQPGRVPLMMLPLIGDARSEIYHPYTPRGGSNWKIQIYVYPPQTFASHRPTAAPEANSGVSCSPVPDGSLGWWCFIWLSFSPVVVQYPESQQRLGAGGWIV